MSGVVDVVLKKANEINYNKGKRRKQKHRVVVSIAEDRKGKGVPLIWCDAELNVVIMRVGFRK